MNSMRIAVGLAEFSTIACGIAGMDDSVKNNDIKLIMADMVCPGKFLLVFGGKHAAVYEAVKRLSIKYAECILHYSMIGNLSEGILNISGDDDCIAKEAVGIIETRNAASAIVAADEAIKAANITISNVKLANGIGGKGLVAFTGGIAEVNAAVSSAARTMRVADNLVANEVITNPDIQTISRLCRF